VLTSPPNQTCLTALVDAALTDALSWAEDPPLSRGPTMWRRGSQSRNLADCDPEASLAHRKSAYRMNHFLGPRA
jgi:hypothetical protein